MVAAVEDAAPPSWMTSIQQFIEFEILPSDPSEATLLRKREDEYIIVKGTLCKRSLPMLLLRCLGKVKVIYFLL